MTVTWTRHKQTNTRATWYTSDGGRMIQLLRSGSFVGGCDMCLLLDVANERLANEVSEGVTKVL